MQLQNALGYHPLGNFANPFTTLPYKKNAKCLLAKALTSDNTSLQIPGLTQGNAGMTRPGFLNTRLSFYLGF